MEPNINIDPEMIQRALSATGLNQNNPSAIDFNTFIGDNPYYTRRAAPAPSMVLPPTTTPNPYVTAGQASGTPVIDPNAVSSSIYNNPAVARALEDLNIPVNASGIPTGANPITQTLGNLSAETGNRLALGLDVAPTEFEPTFFDQQIANVVAPTTVPTSVYNNPEVAAVLDRYQVPTTAAGVPTDVNPVTELLGNLGAETTNRLAMGLDVAPTEFTPSFAPPAEVPPPEALGASAVERASAPAATVAPTPAPAPTINAGMGNIDLSFLQDSGFMPPAAVAPAPVAVTPPPEPVVAPPPPPPVAPTPDYAAMQNDARETMDALSRSSLGSFLGITPRAPAPAPMPVTPPPAVAPAPMPVTPPPAVAPAPMPTPVVDSEGIGSLRAPSERAEPALPPVVAAPAPAPAPVPVMPPPEPVVAPPPAPMPAPVAAPAPVVAPPPPPPAPVVDSEGIGSLVAPPVAVAPPPPPPVVAPTPVAPPPEPVVAPAPPPPPAPIPAPAEPVFTPTPMPAPTPVRAEPVPARAPSERFDEPPAEALGLPAVQRVSRPDPVVVTPQNVTQPTGQTATEQLNMMANADLARNLEPITEGVGSLVATTPDIQEMVLPAAPPAAPAVMPQVNVASGIPQFDLAQIQQIASRLPFNLFSGIR